MFIESAPIPPNIRNAAGMMRPSETPQGVQNVTSARAGTRPYSGKNQIRLLKVCFE